MNVTEKEQIYLINDVSEIKSDLVSIPEFMKLVVASDPCGGLGGPAWANYKIIGESEIKKRVFEFLSKQPKYNLIVTGDRRGTMLFPAWEVERFGDKIMRLAYSHHHWFKPHETLKNEVKLLGKKPRILLLESDSGEWTSTKLREAIDIIQKIRPDATVDVVVGVATKRFMHQGQITYAAYPVESRGVRLSEIIEKDTAWRKRDKTKIVERMNKLREHRRIMRMTPRIKR